MQEAAGTPTARHSVSDRCSNLSLSAVLYFMRSGELSFIEKAALTDSDT